MLSLGQFSGLFVHFFNLLFDLIFHLLLYVGNAHFGLRLLLINRFCQTENAAIQFVVMKFLEEQLPIHFNQDLLLLHSRCLLGDFCLCLFPQLVNIHLLIFQSILYVFQLVFFLLHFRLLLNHICDQVFFEFEFLFIFRI